MCRTPQPGLLAARSARWTMSDVIVKAGSRKALRRRKKSKHGSRALLIASKMLMVQRLATVLNSRCTSATCSSCDSSGPKCPSAGVFCYALMFCSACTAYVSECGRHMTLVNCLLTVCRRSFRGQPVAVKIAKTAADQAAVWREVAAYECMSNILHEQHSGHVHTSAARARLHPWRRRVLSRDDVSGCESGLLLHLVSCAVMVCAISRSKSARSVVQTSNHAV